MAIDNWDRIWICDGDLVGLDPHKLAVLLVQVEDRKIPSGHPTFVQVP